MKMKRYVTLYAFTAVIISGLVLFSVFSKNSVVQVSTVKVNSITVENSVTCSGRVERIATTSVYAPASGIIQSIYVKEGDKVQAGQTLMTVRTVSDASNFSGEGASDLASRLPDGYESLLGLYGKSSLPSSSRPEQISVKSITAPVSGVITSVSAFSQGYVSVSSSVAVIADNVGLQVRLSVNESQIPDIRVGQKAVINGVGFKNSSYSGKVTRISSDAKQIATTTGQETVVEVLVSVDKAGQDIKPGYSAKVKIVTSRNSGVLIAPYEAVRADKNGNEYVFRLKGNHALKTPIVTGQEFDSGFSVASGLTGNDVVIENPDNLSNGTRVIPSEKGAARSDD